MDISTTIAFVFVGVKLSNYQFRLIKDEYVILTGQIRLDINAKALIADFIKWKG